MLKNFEINEQYFCDENVTAYKDHLENRKNPTPDDMIKILKGTDRSMVSTSHRDHPEFSKLRDQLEHLGYIKTVRNSWNGDIVLKSFKLNGWTFRKGHKFPCAAALAVSLSCARKHSWRTISSY